MRFLLAVQILLASQFAFATTNYTSNFICTASTDPTGSEASNGALITAEAGCVFSSNTAIDPALELVDTSSLDMTAGSVEGLGYGLYAIGSGGSVTISGGSISAPFAIFLDGTYSDFDISGTASVQGASGLSALNGTTSVINISGGTFSDSEALRPATASS